MIKDPKTFHKCLITAPRPTDYFMGDGHIVFSAVLASGDWSKYFHFNEHQKELGFDCDGCVCFSCQKIFDAQVDYLIQSGQIQRSVISNFTALGFMDAVNSDDKLSHFHSSPRWLQSMTGNGYNGNPLYAPWDILRKQGTLPWVDCPFDPSVNASDYLIKPTQAQLDKAKSLIPLLSTGYHWIVDNGSLKGTPISQMKKALQQSPLQIGINCGDNWNSVNPTPTADLSPEHSVSVEKVTTVSVIDDQYEPFIKDLPFSWNIGYILQAIVSPVPQAPAPLETLQPVSTPVTPEEKMSLIQQLGVIAQQLINWITNNPKGR